MNKYLRHILSEVHDPSTGLINGVLFADVLGLSYDDMATLLNRTVPGLKKNPTSENLQPRLLELYVLIVQIRDILDNSMDNVRIWLRAPNRVLNYQTPLSLLLDDKLEEINTLVQSMHHQEKESLVPA